MKTNGEVEVKFHKLLNSEMDEGKWSPSGSGQFIRGTNYI
jgi:hypothetical protein